MASKTLPLEFLLQDEAIKIEQNFEEDSDKFFEEYENDPFESEEPPTKRLKRSSVKNEISYDENDDYFENPEEDEYMQYENLKI